MSLIDKDRLECVLRDMAHKHSDKTEHDKGWVKGMYAAINQVSCFSAYKPTIPQSVSKYIDQAYEQDFKKRHYPLAITTYVLENVKNDKEAMDWLEEFYNQKLLLFAIANGYEVEG